MILLLHTQAVSRITPITCGLADLICEAATEAVMDRDDAIARRLIDIVMHKTLRPHTSAISACRLDEFAVRPAVTRRADDSA